MNDDAKMPRTGWRKVANHPDYEAHSDGLLRRRIGKSLLNGWKGPGKNPATMVTLCSSDGGRRTCQKGLVVAEVFCRKPRRSSAKLRLQYVNGDRMDCRASNLAWVKV